MMFVNEPGRMIRDCVGVIEHAVGLIFGLVLRIGEWRDVLIASRQRVRIEKTSRAVDGSVETIETSLQRPIVFVGIGLWLDHFGDVPLAGHVVPVVGRLQCFGDRHTVAIQVTAISVMPAVVHHVSDARLMRIEPAHQARPSRATSRRVVKLGESQSAVSQRIQVRRVNLAA